MTTYGFCKEVRYSGDGTLMIRTRVPTIHGPYRQNNAMGKPLRNYTRDEDLPFYPSVLLPYMPKDGDVVVVTSLNDGNTGFIIIGLTGGSYQLMNSNQGG